MPDRDAYNRSLVDEMHRYYQDRAPWHDRYMNYTTQADMEITMRPILDVVTPLIRDLRVLEIACGTGNWTGILATYASSVVATDSSGTALKLAANKLRDKENVTLHQCDAYDRLPFEDDVDVVIAADFWSHIPRGLIPKFLEQVLRQMKSSAHLVLTDMLMKPFFEQEECYHDNDGNRVSTRMLPDGKSYRVVKNFPTEFQLRHDLADHTTEISFYTYPDLERWLLIARFG